MNKVTDDPAGKSFVRILRNWRNGRGPLWLRLADEVDRAIERGDLTQGERVPSERYLAKELEVGRSTVVRAFSTLAVRGAVNRERGSGTFVSATANPNPPRPKGPWPLSEYHRTTDRVPVGLGAAVIPTPQGLPSELLTLNGEDLRDQEESQSGYMLPGLPSTREAVAAMLRAEGVPASADCIVITTGATQGMALLIDLLLRPDDVVIVDRRAYPGTLALLRRAGARVIAAPENGAGNTDTAAVHRYALQHSAAAVVLMTTCNAATGGTIPASDRGPLLDLAANGVAVIDDRTLADFHPDPPPALAALSQHRNIFTVGSLNKVYWGGLRLGWTHTRESLVPQLVRAKSANDSGSSVPSQLIANRLLANHGQVQRLRRASVQESRRAALAQLKEDLPQWEVEGEPHGPAMWVRLPVRDTGSFVEHAFSQGNGISYGGDYRADGRRSQHVRLSLTNPAETTARLIHELAGSWSDFLSEARDDELLE